MKKVQRRFFVNASVFFMHFLWGGSLLCDVIVIIRLLFYIFFSGFSFDVAILIHNLATIYKTQFCFLIKILEYGKENPNSYGL